jgi:prepilin-type processing-associated H-X9-DG protein
MKQLGLALHGYHDANGKLPPGSQQLVFRVPRPANQTGQTFCNTPNNNCIRGTSWITFTLPHIEQEALFRQYNFGVAYFDNDPVGLTVVPTLYCPAGPDAKRHLDPNSNVAGCVTTHYYGIMGPGGPSDNFTLTVGGRTFTYRRGDATSNAAWSNHGMLSQLRENSGSISSHRVVKLTDATDGLTNTLMLGEMSMSMPGSLNQYRTFIRGNNGGTGATKNIKFPINSTFYNGSNNFNDISMGSNHSGGCNFCLGDGSVRFIRQTIDLNIYIAASSCDQGELAPLD